MYNLGIFNDETSSACLIKEDDITLKFLNETLDANDEFCESVQQ